MDSKKRRGVRVLETSLLKSFDMHGLQSHEVLREKWMTWMRLQPVFLSLSHGLLSGAFQFPRLKIVEYDGADLVDQRSLEGLLAFFRRHQSIKALKLSGHISAKLIRSCGPKPCHFPFLQALDVYGPFIPLLLGYTFKHNPANPEKANLGPLFKVFPHRVESPIRDVKIAWPDTVVKVLSDPPVDLRLEHVLEALASACKKTLRSLVIELPDGTMDITVIECISRLFPNLTKLVIHIMDVSTNWVTNQVCFVLVNIILSPLADDEPQAFFPQCRGTHRKIDASRNVLVH
ncbi:hypothetical protein AX17_005261 [Amanita inopinata Kibby_2008]|nr:hypothetical protein AX17_005261 [Amanita inopinata Kibby_2008]